MSGAATRYAAVVKARWLPLAKEALEFAASKR